MSIALRLNDDLVHEAETEAQIHKRSTPKQIEYWAQIGKAVARNASSSDLLALMQGFAQVQVNTRPSAPVDPDKVFAAVEQSRSDGSLHQAVSQARERYEASQTHPGLLDRVLPDGQRETGHFQNGEFVPVR
ncbi:MAG: hypothetical protein ABFS39_18825 [Pseudomonadota bacterium]